MGTLKLYEVPTIECFNIRVEAGFATSNGDFKGDDLTPGGALSWRDYEDFEPSIDLE